MYLDQLSYCSNRLVFRLHKSAGLAFQLALHPVCVLPLLHSVVHAFVRNLTISDQIVATIGKKREVSVFNL